ncbi:MAG: DUF6262 family protein, partial [Pseudolysinimonas sp.]
MGFPKSYVIVEEGPAGGTPHAEVIPGLSGGYATPGRATQHADAHQRAQETIRTAHATGQRVSVSALAAQAGVSRAFLYAHPDLAAAARRIASSA